MNAEERYPPEPPDAVAMQTRCPHCDREQYMMNVIAFSHGEVTCMHCGEASKEMTKAEWIDALQKTRERLRQQPRGNPPATGRGSRGSR